MASELTPPSIVYHYTDTMGMLGILTGRMLWSSDVEFMNDAQELTYARACIRQTLQAEVDSYKARNKTDDGPESMRIEMIESLIGELEPSGEAPPSGTYHIYATCFCEQGDLLSQWRAYGGQGGYAIGLWSDRLSDQLTDASPHFAKVTYGLDAARPDIDLLVKSATSMPAGFPGATAN